MCARLQKLSTNTLHRRLALQTRRNTAKRKDAAYHTRGSPSRLMISSILSAASAILFIESAILS